VFQYDFDKAIQDQSFQQTKFLKQPPILLRTAIIELEAQYESFGHQFEDIINSLLKKKPRLWKRFKRPDLSSDRLYKSEVIHLMDKKSCAAVCGDDLSNIVPRKKQAEYEDNPAIHYGLIASVNQLMKDALIKDKLAAEKDVLYFEMEVARLLNHFPCLVIRGICDYSDSHKNEEWQGYAAITAAAYAKDLLSQITPSQIKAAEKINNYISGNSLALDLRVNIH
jgi:hypothetical protein